MLDKDIRCLKEFQLDDKWGNYRHMNVGDYWLFLDRPRGTYINYGSGGMFEESEIDDLLKEGFIEYVKKIKWDRSDEIGCIQTEKI